jgi:hypothetical protein
MGKPAINGGSASKPCRWINTLVTFTNFCKDEIIITKGPTFGFSIKSRKVSIWVDSFQKKLGFCTPNMKTVGIAIFLEQEPEWMIGVACRPSWEKHHSLDWFSRGK